MKEAKWSVTGKLGHLTVFHRTSSANCHSPIPLSKQDINSNGHLKQNPQNLDCCFDLSCLLEREKGNFVLSLPSFRVETHLSTLEMYFSSKESHFFTAETNFSDVEI